MGIFNTIRKALRKGKALPNEFGPVYAFKEAETVKPAKVSVKVVKATTDDKPATIPSDYAKAVVAKQKAATKAKPSKDAENKKPATKKAPVAKKPVAKKAPAKAPAKKSTPKKK